MFDHKQLEDDAVVDDLVENSRKAAEFVKAFAHDGRLMILCNLTSGEWTVTELERRLPMRQSSISQQLARLRLEGIIGARRDGKQIYYSLVDPKAKKMMEMLFELFCDS